MADGSAATVRAPNASPRWLASGASGQSERVAARLIPSFRLVLEPLPEEAETLLERPSCVAEAVGTRHRLGGTPDLPPEVVGQTARRTAQ